MAKVMVSIPDGLLAEIDDEARRRATSRSAFLQQAAARELGRPTREELEAAFERARALGNDTVAAEAADLIRADRDERDARDRRR